MSSKASKVTSTDSAKRDKPVPQQEPKVSSSNNNNNNDQQEEELLPKHWTKVASKKHPGKYYYFNVTTKESLWEHPGRTKALEAEKNIIRNVKASKEKHSPKSEKVMQLKNDTVQFKKKNLAKDRLEKLQKQLEVERRQETTKKKLDLEKVQKEAKTPETPRKKSSVKSSPVKEDKPAEQTTPSRQSRKRVGSDNSSESPSSRSKSSKLSPKSVVISKKVPPKVEQKKLRKAEDSKKKDQDEPVASKQLKSFKIPKKATQEPVSSSIFVDVQKLTEAKPVVQSPKTDPTISIPPENPVPKERPKIAEEVARSSPKISYAQKLLEAIERPQASPSPRTASEKVPAFTSTPKVQALIRAEVDSPNFVKSPANERLAGIREKLAQEVALESTLLDEDAEMTDLSDAQPQDHQSSSLEAEAMDWEDIPEDVALREVVAVRRLPISKESVLDATIPGYGTHLLEQGHFQRYVLLVMDTNVFLSHLKGVERLIEKGFPRIGQPILIVPYIVLQELDRIKHREQGKPLSQAAAHSIRFLNDHLKRRDPRVKGQSTMEAANQLIPVENADDNIINCCLQVRQIVAGNATDLMLLSNDVNLRNKALVNGIQAFGYGELMVEANRIRLAADEQIAGQ